MTLHELRIVVVAPLALAFMGACGSSGGDSGLGQGPGAAVVPSQRGGAPAAWMPAAGQMMIFGGMDPITNDTFSFDHDARAWRELAPQLAGAVPASRCHHTLAEVPGADQAILFGGFSRGTRFNDTWRFDLATESWTELTTQGATPARRCLHASAFIESRGELVVYGGIAGSGTRASDFFDDTHVLDLATGLWTRLEGDGPSAREGAVMVYSRTFDAVFLWGGKAFDHYPTELWRFDVVERVWSQTATTGDTPTGREDPTYFWDAGRDRLTVFSGRNDNDRAVLFDDGYELDLVAADWARVDADVMPPARWRASAAVDPASNRGYMFGGWRDFGGRDAFNDTWSYDLESRTWTRVTVE
ncbi:MAG: hypothetical protein O7F08_03950 [Deltaproteobacteria bacterium]|nr:hypothetical protein [Deltaproteobacteria bacterium]